MTQSLGVLATAATLAVWTVPTVHSVAFPSRRPVSQVDQTAALSRTAALSFTGTRAPRSDPSPAHCARLGPLHGARTENWLLDARRIAAQELRSIWDGVYTEAQARRGSAIYEQECARCHGATLEGSGETAGPLTGITFNSTWNGLTIGDLLDRIRLTMPVDKPGKLTRQQYVDVLSYMLSVGKFPPGEAELPREAERLNLIVFDPFKVR